MYCKYCGKPLESEDTPCPFCGNLPRRARIQAAAPKAKSRVAAGWLGILLGGFGAHNFYVGNTGKAIAQLLITLLSCGTLFFISAIWGLVEGIWYLTGKYGTDATGQPLAF